MLILNITAPIMKAINPKVILAQTRKMMYVTVTMAITDLALKFSKKIKTSSKPSDAMISDNVIPSIQVRVGGKNSRMANRYALKKKPTLE